MYLSLSLLFIFYRNRSPDPFPVNRNVVCFISGTSSYTLLFCVRCVSQSRKSTQSPCCQTGTLPEPHAGSIPAHNRTCGANKQPACSVCISVLFSRRGAALIFTARSGSVPALLQSTALYKDATDQNRLLLSFRLHDLSSVHHRNLRADPSHYMNVMGYKQAGNSRSL